VRGWGSTLPLVFGAIGMVLLGRHSDRTMERKGHVAAALLMASRSLRDGPPERPDGQLHCGPAVAGGLLAGGRDSSWCCCGSMRGASRSRATLRWRIRGQGR
jgi:hypothetical protein